MLACVYRYLLMIAQRPSNEAADAVLRKLRKVQYKRPRIYGGAESQAGIGHGMPAGPWNVIVGLALLENSLLTDSTWSHGRAYLGPLCVPTPGLGGPRLGTPACEFQSAATRGFRLMVRSTELLAPFIR